MVIRTQCFVLECCSLEQLRCRQHKGAWAQSPCQRDSSLVQQGESIPFGGNPDSQHGDFLILLTNLLLQWHWIRNTGRQDQSHNQG